MHTVASEYSFEQSSSSLQQPWKITPQKNKKMQAASVRGMTFLDDFQGLHIKTAYLEQF